MSRASTWNRATIGPPEKCHSNPNDVWLVWWSKWCRWPDSTCFLASIKTKTILNFMLECVVWKRKYLSHVRELYIPPNVYNCRCVDAPSLVYTDFKILPAKAGQVEGLSIRPFICPSLCYTFGMPILCKICNSKGFPSILFNLCKEWLFTYWRYKLYIHFVHISWIFSHFWGVLNFGIFPTQKCLDGVWNSNNFYSFIFKLFIHIGLQNRLQNFIQRASKGIQIGSVVFVAIFSWRSTEKHIIQSSR